jgi:hypothetical protein
MIMFKVPFGFGREENWEAGEKPALPPQRWRSEYPTGDHWAHVREGVG